MPFFGCSCRIGGKNIPFFIERSFCLCYLGHHTFFLRWIFYFLSEPCKPSPIFTVQGCITFYLLAATHVSDFISHRFIFMRYISSVLFQLHTIRTLRTLENPRSTGRLFGAQNSCFIPTDPSNNRVYNGVYNIINFNSEIETCNLNHISNKSFVIDGLIEKS